jgi:predicted metal-dependent hydrolase
MLPTLPDTITAEGITLTLRIERKAVKNVNARLRGSTLSVSAPRNLAQKDLEPIVRQLARKLVRREHAQRINEEEDALGLACKIARRFPRPPNVERVLFVSTQRSRWGSYSQRTGTVRLNAGLRSMPRWVLEAVVAHELAHVIHPDHSPAFWDLLGRVCPEKDRAKAFLEGVSWLGHNLQRLPLVERTLLTGMSEHNEEE